MIPALLSVLFVVYLYQSLNESSAPTPETLVVAGSVGASKSGEAEQLAARLRELQAKVTKLTTQALTPGK